MIQKVFLSEPAPGASSRYDTEGVSKRTRGLNDVRLKVGPVYLCECFGLLIQIFTPLRNRAMNIRIPSSMG